MGSVVVMLAFASALGVVVYLLISRVAYANVEAVVDSRVREVRAQVAQMTASGPDLVATETVSPVMVQVFDAAGALVAESPGLPPGRRLCQATPGYLTASRTAPSSLGSVTICAAASLHSVERAQDGVLVALAIMVPLVLVGVGLASWIAVGRALRSVDALRRQAEEITGADDGSLVVEPTGDEIEQLARTLNALLDRVHANARSTRQFVEDAGHELRNPLATLRVALEFDDGSAVTRELALAEISRLEDLTSALLVLARTQAREGVVWEEVDLGGVVRASVEARSPVRPSIEIRADLVEAAVRGDRRTIRSALDNLLANALRHARSTVTVRVSRHCDGWLLAVDDDGSGIAAEDCVRVFDRFVRLDEARDRDDGGSGLGLAIVAAVAQAHHGRAWAEPGPGGRFRILLPAASAVRPGTTDIDEERTTDRPGT